MNLVYAALLGAAVALVGRWAWDVFRVQRRRKQIQLVALETLNEHRELIEKNRIDDAKEAKEEAEARLAERLKAEKEKAVSGRGSFADYIDRFTKSRDN